MALLQLLVLYQQLLLHALQQVANVALPWLHLSFNIVCYLLQAIADVAAEGCQSLLDAFRKGTILTHCCHGLPMSKMSTNKRLHFNYSKYGLNDTDPGKDSVLGSDQLAAGVLVRQGH